MHPKELSIKNFHPLVGVPTEQNPSSHGLVPHQTGKNILVGGDTDQGKNPLFN
jgi:hypothetical protein